MGKLPKCDQQRFSEHAEKQSAVLPGKQWGQTRRRGNKTQKVWEKGRPSSSRAFASGLRVKQSLTISWRVSPLLDLGGKTTARDNSISAGGYQELPVSKKNPNKQKTPCFTKLLFLSCLSKPEIPGCWMLLKGTQGLPPDQPHYDRPPKIRGDRFQSAGPLINVEEVVRRDRSVWERSLVPGPEAWPGGMPSSHSKLLCLGRHRFAELGEKNKHGRNVLRTSWVRNFYKLIPKAHSKYTYKKTEKSKEIAPKTH